MPYLFSLGVRSALASVSGRLEPGEHLFAFLDDVSWSASLNAPERYTRCWPGNSTRKQVSVYTKAKLVFGMLLV